MIIGQLNGTKEPSISAIVEVEILRLDKPNERKESRAAIVGVAKSDLAITCTRCVDIGIHDRTAAANTNRKASPAVSRNRRGKALAAWRIITVCHSRAAIDRDRDQRDDHFQLRHVLPPPLTAHALHCVRTGESQLRRLLSAQFFRILMLGHVYDSIDQANNAQAERPQAMRREPATNLSSRQLFEHLIGDLEVGEHVLHVVVVF